MDKLRTKNHPFFLNILSKNIAYKVIEEKVAMPTNCIPSSFVFLNYHMVFTLERYR